MSQQSLSIKPGRVSVKSPVVQRETSIVDVSKVVGISVGSPVKEVGMGGKVKGYFGKDTALIFIGIMVGIVSLAVSLWSMHKNSVLTKRLTEMNSSMVDIIVESKKENSSGQLSRVNSSAGFGSTPSSSSSSSSFSTVVPKPSSLSQAQAIRERLREKRAANADSRLLLEEQSRKAENLRLEQAKVLQRLEMEAVENRKMMEKNQATILSDANKSLADLRERRHKKPVPIMQTDPRKLFPEPHNPIPTLFDSLQTSKTTLSKNTPLSSSISGLVEAKEQVITNYAKEFGTNYAEEEKVEIDIDDLERDLMFLKR